MFHYSTGFFTMYLKFTDVWNRLLTCRRPLVFSMLKKLDSGYPCRRGEGRWRAPVYRTDYWPAEGSLVTSMVEEAGELQCIRGYWPIGGSLVTSMLKRLDTQEGRRERRAVVYRTDYWPAWGSLVTSMLKRLESSSVLRCYWPVGGSWSPACRRDWRAPVY